MSGSNGTSEKVVLFSRTEFSKRKFVNVLLCSLAAYVRFSKLAVTYGTDLYKW